MRRNRLDDSPVRSSQCRRRRHGILIGPTAYIRFLGFLAAVYACCGERTPLSIHQLAWLFPHRSFPPSCVPLELRPLPIPRRYPASSVLRASPPPRWPRLVLADSRLARARHPRGFPCCCSLPVPCVLAPIPRRKRIGASVAHFPTRRRPSPRQRRVGFRIVLFEACTAFTRVLARRVAEPPKAALCHQSASVHFVTSTNRPGCYQPERQLLRGIPTH